MAQIPLTINNGTPPYTISVKIVGDNTERFISYSSSIVTFTPDNSGDTKTYNLTVLDSESCSTSGSFGMSCGGNAPTFQYFLRQPYCEEGGSSLQPALVQIRNISNAVRYKICENTTSFNCDSTCTTSDGTISGSSVDISIAAPAAGSSKNLVIRLYSNSGCDTYNDILVQITSPNCNQVTFLNLDYRFYKSSDLNNCATAVTNDYDIYATLNTVGVSENGQQALTKGGSNKNIPNGNSVPNVFAAAAPNISHGPGSFYRFQFNLLELKSKYPAIDTFTFDIYANRILGFSLTNPVFTQLTPVYNVFSSVAMVNRIPDSTCVANTNINRTDAERFPSKPQTGGQVTPGTHNYNTAITGFRKIATFSITYSTGAVSWTNL